MKQIEGMENLFGGLNRAVAGAQRALHQDHRQSQSAGRRKLGIGPFPTGILGDEPVDTVLTHSNNLVVALEWAAPGNNLDVAQLGRDVRRIDDADDIVVLRLFREWRQRLAADRQKNTLGTIRQGSGGGFDVCHKSPTIAGDRCPRGPFKRDQRYACQFGGGGGVGADARGEGVGGVDQCRNAPGAKIRCKPFKPAKTTRAGGDRWQPGRNRASGQRQSDNKACLARQTFGDQVGLGCAAKDENVQGVGTLRVVLG